MSAKRVAISGTKRDTRQKSVMKSGLPAYFFSLLISADDAVLTGPIMKRDRKYELAVPKDHSKKTMNYLPTAIVYMFNFLAMSSHISINSGCISLASLAKI